METSLPTADLDRLLRHTEWLRRLAQRLVADSAAAEDLVQETFLAALKHPPDPARPARPWLAGVMRNLVRLRARGDERRRRRQERAARSDELPSTSELLEKVDTGRRLAEVVVALPEPYRTTMLLHYYHELSAAEISRRQGIPSATVRWRIKRGLEELRTRLDRAWSDRQSWCVALGALVGGGETGGALVPVLAGQGLLLAKVAKSLVVLLLAGAVGWIALWLVREEDRPRELRAAALERPSPPPEPATADVASMLAPPDTLAEIERSAGGALEPTPPRRLHLTLREHDDRPAASWRGIVARGAGSFEPFVLDEQGAIELAAPSEPAHLFLARPDAPIAHVALEPGEGQRLLYLPRGREVSGRVLVGGRAPQEQLTLALSTDRTLHAELLAELGLELGVFFRELARGRRTPFVTEPDGSFRVHGLDADWSGLVLLPGSFRLAGRELEVDPRNLVLQDGELVGPTVQLAGPTSGLSIELEPLPRVRGRVVEEDGAPIPGALYQVHFQLESALLGPKDPRNCGPDGSFEASFPDTGTSSAVVRYWDAAGRRAGELALSRKELVGDVELGDLALAPAVSLELAVVDADERPIAGARALCDGMLEPSAPSGEDGRIPLTGVSSRAGRILVGAPGRLGLHVELPDDPEPLVVVHLARANRLVVRVDDPVLGTSVRLSASRGPFAGGAPRPDALAAKALGERLRTGRFQCEGTSITLDVQEELALESLEPHVPLKLELLDSLGEVAGVRELAPLGSEEERIVELAAERPLAAFAGRTVLEGVGALVGAIVVVTSPSGGRAMRRTDNSGEFAFQGLSAELVDVEIHKPGFVRIFLDDQPVSVSHSDAPLEVRLERGVAVRIALVDADGRPVEGGAATATRADDGRAWEARETEPGWLELEDVPASRLLRIELRARGRTLVREHDPLAGELRVEIAD